MSSPSFASVLADLCGDVVPDVFICIAVDRNVRCTRHLNPHDLALAIEHIRNDSATTNVRITRSIIDWLVCPEHRLYTSNTHNTLFTNRIEVEWQPEFGSDYFKVPRSPRQPSRSGDTKASPRTGTPVEPDRDRNGRPAPASTQSDRGLTVRGSDPFGSPLARHQRALSEVGTAASSSSSHNAVPQITTEDVDMDPFATDGDEHGNLSISGLTTNPRVLQGQLASQLLQDRLRDAAAQADRRLAPEIHEHVPTTHAGGSSRLRGSSRRRGSSTSQLGFEPGDMSRWAPQTAHDAMKDLLGQPLESEKTRGYLYIFPDVNKQYVKIGITTGRLSERFNNIEKSCGSIVGLSLDFDSRRSLPNIPYLQLLRLEKLVHTDLAHYHRHLCVASGSRWRTQHEWFEIDAESAYKTAEYWWGVMKRNDIKPGRRLNHKFKESLETSADATVLKLAGDLNTDHAWRAVHKDNNLRLHKWTKILPDESKARYLRQWRMWLVSFCVVFVLSTIQVWAGKTVWYVRAAALCVQVPAVVVTTECLAVVMKHVLGVWDAVKAYSTAV